MHALCTKSESFTRLLDEEERYRQLRRLRWSDGKVCCPYCGSDQITKSWRYFREPACFRYQYDSCGLSFNDKTGTIFEHSKLPLSAWFLGFYLAQLSQSTSTIAKELPCHYRTAHRIVWLVREQVVRLAHPLGIDPMGTPAAQALPPYRVDLGVPQGPVAPLLVVLEGPPVTVRVGTHVRRIHHVGFHLGNTYTQAHLPSSCPRWAYFTMNFPMLETVTPDTGS